MKSNNQTNLILIDYILRQQSSDIAFHNIPHSLYENIFSCIVINIKIKNAVHTFCRHSMMQHSFVHVKVVPDIYTSKTIYT